MTVPANRSGLSWGVSTLGCPELTLPEVCELLGEFNLHELEIRPVDGRLDLPQWIGNKRWPPQRARDLLAKYQIQFCVGGSSLKLVGSDAKSRAGALTFCAWADSWGARYVRAFGGGTWGRPLTEADYDEAARTIEWWQREKKLHGWHVDLLLETHDGFSASGPCRELLARLRDPIGIIWDSHHTWRLGGESPRESWSQLSRWIRHVHIKDSITKPSERHPFTYVLPGDGEVPLGKIVEVLSEHHFPGVVSLEWERLWHSYLPPLREALAQLQTQPWFLPSVKYVDEHQPPAVAY